MNFGRHRHPQRAECRGFRFLIARRQRLDDRRRQILGRRSRNANANVSAKFDLCRRRARHRALVRLRRNHHRRKSRRRAPKLIPPAINKSRRRATAYTDAPGANASATIDRFSSALHRRRRSGPDRTSTRLMAPSLASVQTTVLAPMQKRSDQPTARKAAAIGRVRLNIAKPKRCYHGDAEQKNDGAPNKV